MADTPPVKDKPSKPSKPDKSVDRFCLDTDAGVTIDGVPIAEYMDRPEVKEQIEKKKAPAPKA